MATSELGPVDQKIVTEFARGLDEFLEREQMFQDSRLPAMVAYQGLRNRLQLPRPSARLIPLLPIEFTESNSHDEGEVVDDNR